MAGINKIVIALGFLSLTSLQFVLSRRIRDKNEFPDLGIVNGKKSTMMKPWMCAIWKKNKLSCGCSILSSTKVLTAAHCLQRGVLASDLQVGVGDLHKDFQTKYPVKFYINHANYSDKIEYANDVAIITLKVPIIFMNRFVGPITLSDCKEEIPANTRAFIQGWGKRSSNSNEISDELYEAEILVLSKNDKGCKIYENRGWLSNSMICAGRSNGGIDSCQGDSGGPMTNIFNEQIGIVSWGEGCGQPKAPGVYTNICAIKKWIISNWYKTKK